MENPDLKRISCKRCQHRKIRCTRVHPCKGCTSAGVKCEFRDADYKRPPVSREYAAALESRVGSLEGILARLKRASGYERDAILDEVVFYDHLQAFESPLQNQGFEVSQTITKASMQETAEGLMIYHGPTSIFLNEGSKIYGPGSPPCPMSKLTSYEDGASYHNPTIRLCIALFFYWQYPQFMFISREAFVREYDTKPVDGTFCSPSLIHIICALGSLMSPNPEIKALSASFADAAETALVKQDLASPSVTSVQALLCCAYYEAGRGNQSKAWLYSGMAFRMGQDLGFQRDPANWKYPAPGWPEPCLFHIEWRRRMYWGSFLSDKIFSLFLGRPTFMQEKDADVDMPEPLPQTHRMWEQWLEQHELGFLDTYAPGPGSTLLFNQQVEIGRIIHETLSSVFSPPQRKGDAKSNTWTMALLQQLNVRLLSWYEALPRDMRWKKWFTNKDYLHPGLATLHTLYHSTRICFNLPFIISLANPEVFMQQTPGMPNPLTESINICKSSAEEMVTILQRYQSRHTLGNTPLILVQGAIVATKAVMVTARIGDMPVSLLDDTPFPILDAALAEMSVSWKLASDARQRFKEALSYSPPSSSASTSSVSSAASHLTPEQTTMPMMMAEHDKVFEPFGDLLEIPGMMQHGHPMITFDMSGQGTVLME